MWVCVGGGGDVYTQLHEDWDSCSISVYSFIFLLWSWVSKLLMIICFWNVSVIRYLTQNDASHISFLHSASTHHLTVCATSSPPTCWSHRSQIVYRCTFLCQYFFRDRNFCIGSVVCLFQAPSCLYTLFSKIRSQISWSLIQLTESQS